MKLFFNFSAAFIVAVNSYRAGRRPPATPAKEELTQVAPEPVKPSGPEVLTRRRIEPDPETPLPSTKPKSSGASVKKKSSTEQAGDDLQMRVRLRQVKSKALRIRSLSLTGRKPRPRRLLRSASRYPLQRALRPHGRSIQVETTHRRNAPITHMAHWRVEENAAQQSAANEILPIRAITEPHQFAEPRPSPVAQSTANESSIRLAQPCACVNPWLAPSCAEIPFEPRERRRANVAPPQRRRIRLEA